MSRRLLPLALRLWLHCSTPPVEAVTRRNKHWSRIYYSTVRRRSPPKLVLPASFGTGRQLVSLWSISTTTTTEEASESAIIASGQPMALNRAGTCGSEFYFYRPVTSTAAQRLLPDAVPLVHSSASTAACRRRGMQVHA